MGANSLLNATFNTSVDTGNVTVFYEGRALNTANSSYSFFANQTNTSGLRHHVFNAGGAATDTLIAEESSAWQYRATCRLNASGNIDIAGESSAVSSESSTTNTLDRGGVPSTPTSLTTAKRVSGDTITATVNGANTTSCTISFGLGGIRNAMTHSGNTCTFTVARDSPADGIYSYNVLAGDGANSSTSSAVQVEIDAIGNPSRRSPASLQISKPISQKLSGMGNVQKIATFALLAVVADILFGLGIIFKKR